MPLNTANPHSRKHHTPWKLSSTWVQLVSQLHAVVSHGASTAWLRKKSCFADAAPINSPARPSVRRCTLNPARLQMQMHSNQVPHECGLEAGGQNREREVRTGVHRNSDTIRQDQASVPDNGEQLRQTRPAGRQSQRHQVRADAGRSSERHRRRTPRGVPQDILDDEVVGPRTGPTQAQGDYHETDPKTNQTTAQTTQRRHLRKRARENGTSGGTRGDDSGHGQSENPPKFGSCIALCFDDYNLFKEKLIARIPKISIPLGKIPLAHDG